MDGRAASPGFARPHQRRTPLLLGALVFGLGGALDIICHVAPVNGLSWLFARLGPDGEVAHLITFVGMVLVVASLVFVGVRRSEE